MKKLLLTVFALSLAAPALAAQQDIDQLSVVTSSREALRTAVNTQLSKVQSNFDEVYAVIDAGPVYVNAYAPADTKVVWIDTDESNAIKVYVGGAWTVVGSGGIAGDDLGGATYGDVVALWTTCTGYLKSDGTCDTPTGSATYPSAAGVANWNGSAWGTSYTVGTAANNLVQLNASAQLPAVSASLLTNFPTLNQDTTGTAGGLSGAPNITVGTISAGAAGFGVDADGDVTAKSVTVTRTTSPTAIDLYEGTGGGDNKLTLTLSGNQAADTTLNADQILVDGDIGSTVQGYDADLASAAGAGAAGVSKYFGTNASSVVGFYDLPSGGGVPTTITVADTTDATAYVALFDSATGDLGPKTDAGITYNAGTGMLTATGFTGPLTGTASGNLTTSSTSTLTNKTLNVEGTGNAITTVDKVWFAAAGCNNTTATSFYDLPTVNAAAAACITGTNTQKGVLDFDAATDESGQVSLALPSDFTGAIDVKYKWLAAATSGNVVWGVQTSCVADAETDDPSWNTASTTTDAAKGTTLQTNDASITGVTATGCAAGELLHLRFFRDADNGSDTMTGDARLIGAEVTLRRVQ